MKPLARLLLLMAFLLPAFALAGVPTNPQKLKASFKLTAREAEKVRLGDIVLREHNKNELFGGTAFAVLPHPIWRLWQVITDFPKYPEFYPRNLSAEILEQGPNRIFLKTRLRGGGQMTEIWNESEIRFYVPAKNRGLLMMTWEAKRSSLKKNYGFWLLEKRGTQTYVVHQTNFLIEGLPHSMVEPSAMAALRKNVEAVNDRGDNPRYTRYPNQIRFAWK